MENNHNALHGLVLAFLLLIVANPAQAVTLSFYPVTQPVAQGETATVDLNISDVVDLAPPSLGAFLVEISFEESILSFDSVAYGPFLGDPADPFKTDIVTTVGTGSVSFDEFSFLFDFELDASQPLRWRHCSAQVNSTSATSS